MNRQLAAQAALCLSLFATPWSVTPTQAASGIEAQDRDAALRALDQQQRDELSRRQRSAPALSASTPAARRPPQPNESPCFVIDTFVLVALAPLTASDIEPELGAFRGRCLGAASLEALRANLNLRLAELGYVTSRATIAEQALNAGTLELGLEIGRVGAVREAPQDGARGGSWQHALNLHPGDVLNVRALDQALDHFNRLPGQHARFVVEPGEAPGLSTVTLQRDLQAPLHWTATLDNAGAREYGRTQAALQVGWDEPLGSLDQLVVSLTTNAPAAATHGRHRGVALTYSVPWHEHLLSASANQTDHVRPVQGTSVAFESRGRERKLELKWQWAAWRDASRRVAFWLAGSRDDARSFIDDTELLVQRRSTVTLEAGLSLSWRLAAAELSLDISDAHTRPVGVANPFLDGGPSRPRKRQLRLGLSAPVTLPGGLAAHYLAQAAAQTVLAGDGGAQLLTLGGRNTVRGFDGDATVAGESGISLRQELRLPAFDGPWPASSLAPYVALDAGTVRGPSSSAATGRTLAGAAAGLRLNLASFNADLALALPLRQPTAFVSRGAAVYLSLGFQH